MASEELDVKLLTLDDRLRLDGPRLRRLRRLGTSPCLVCERPCFPGHLYCSDACRVEVRRHGAPRVELDGVEATVREHADRRGLSYSTVWGRLRAGVGLKEALARPAGPRRASGPRRSRHREEWRDDPV